jgi:hydrogenase nickel incorporation protein HypA/HybF
VVEHVPARVACHDCGAEGEAPTFPLGCASCGGLDVSVVAGEELLVESLELEEASVSDPVPVKGR